ncbi:MAG TPA: hypothetical protein VFH60_12260 [Chloroflexia bacterium]|nr:hypothetical protein [Chloroflexia bacterium]
MAVEKHPIPFDEFAGDVAGFFERVVHGHETLLVEKAKDEIVVVKAARSTRRARVRTSSRPSVNRDAFLATAGGWKDIVDTDKLVEHIYKSRSICL